ncbi:MAG: pyrroline-5-carboxylate reductase, partial [Clostridia bacterium]|nr:pyrroline-5-carboxylate reductase [Clostridia bacterium]
TVLSCNKGGASVQAVKTLEDCGFKVAVEKAVEACTLRANELKK